MQNQNTNKYSELNNEELFNKYQEIRKQFLRSDLGSEQEDEAENNLREITKEIDNRDNFDLAMYKMQAHLNMNLESENEEDKQEIELVSNSDTNKLSSKQNNKSAKGNNNMKTLRSIIKSAIITGAIAIITCIPTFAAEQSTMDKAQELKVIATYTESNDKYYVEPNGVITEYADGTYSCVNESKNEYDLYFPQLGDWSINLNSQQEIDNCIEDYTSHKIDISDTVNTVKDVKVINTYVKSNGSIISEYNDYSWSIVNYNTNEFIFMPAITTDYDIQFKSESDMKDCINNYISARGKLYNK